MDPNTILTKILRRYGVLTEDIRSMQIVESKIKNKIATYADAEDAAIKIATARQSFAQTDVFLEMIGFSQADIRRIKAQESRARGLALIEEIENQNNQGPGENE